MATKKTLFVLAAFSMLVQMVQPSKTLAWGEDGHKTVGAIADQLLHGTPAQREINQLLQPGESLMSVSIWADCAKGYCHAPLTSEMQEFVNANPQHHDYHFTDIPFEKTEYQAGAIGSGPNDVVQIVDQCIKVLSGQSDPQNNPHRFTPRQALLLLSHLVGDIHQPLHVGTAYVDKNDHVAVPISQSQLDSGEIQATHGDNYLMKKTEPLHMYWDTNVVKNAMHHAHAADPQQYATYLLATYTQAEPMSGDIQQWPTLWVQDALQYAKMAHNNLQLGPRAEAQDRTTHVPHFVWPVTVPSTYTNETEAVAERALVQAGKRLAMLLKMIWQD